MRGDRIFATHRVRVSVVIAAPLPYVYDWCTDYREDDGHLTSSNPRFKILKVYDDRIVRIRIARPKATARAIAIELVRLSPPDRWHLDQIDESDLASVDYKLTRLGPRRTRLVLQILERWTTSKFPSPSSYQKSTTVYWEHLGAMIETRYKSGRRAKG